MAPMGHKLDAKLYKLAIYETDGFFAEHFDTLHGENHLGTLVVCLPVPHEGGAFILSDDGNELRLPFDELVKGGQIPWIAFYTDVKHKVEVVKSGMRMTLQFDLTIEKLDPENENSLTAMAQVDRDISEPENKYHFQDYNQEILSSIRNKLNTIFSQQKIQTSEEKLSNLASMTRSKRPRLDDNNDEPIMLQLIKINLFTGDYKSQLNEIQIEKDEDEGGQIEPKAIMLNPDGVAIMLKRRYGATALSPDRLKGSDSVLYYAVKDYFIVELKQIILEQSTDYKGGFKNRPIRVVAFSQISVVQEAYTSDEETEVDQNNKHIPKECKKSYGLQYNPDEEQEEEEEKQLEKAKVKKICLVSGFKSKSLANLINEPYTDYAGNEPEVGVYSYLHAALFIYPKVSS
jgi:hypothetical protein